MFTDVVQRNLPVLFIVQNKPLHFASEFAYVTGPGVMLENPDCFPGYPGYSFVIAPGIVGKVVRDQRRNVFRAFPQRWDFHRKRGYPVVEIFSKYLLTN